MREYTVIANWKMNGDLSLIDEFSSENWEESTVKTVFSLPYLYLLYAKQKGIKNIGAQNVSSQAEGAYTGEISAKMLKEVGCKYCIIGHSERRSGFLESDDILIKKVNQLKNEGILPIYCVGESFDDYVKHNSEDTLEKQITPLLINNLLDDQFIIAYEPVWAIGTGKSATPEYAQKTHNFIRNLIADKSNILAKKVKILYGGSVNANNAKVLINNEDVDGFLVGGASLSLDSFKKIIKEIE